MLIIFFILNFCCVVVCCTDMRERDRERGGGSGGWGHHGCGETASVRSLGSGGCDSGIESVLRLNECHTSLYGPRPILPKTVKMTWLTLILVFISFD